MIFLPSDRFTIRTNLTPNQIQQKLSNELETVPLAAWSSLTTGKAYRGKVEENRFEITPIVFYNHFTPVIKGEVFDTTGGTQVQVIMLPRPYLTMFTTLLLGFFGFIFFCMLASWIFSIGTVHASPATAILLPGGLFVLAYLLLVGRFALETGKSKERLMLLLGASEEQS